MTRLGMKRVPKRDSKVARMLDRAPVHARDATVVGRRGDVLAGGLEAPVEARAEIGHERMLKVSFPPLIECNPAAGQVEALDARALACDRAFDFLPESPCGGD